MRNAICFPSGAGAISAIATSDFAIVAAHGGTSGRESDIALYIVDLKGKGVERRTLIGARRSIPDLPL